METAMESGSPPESVTATEKVAEAAPQAVETPKVQPVEDRQSRNWRALERDRDYWRQQVLSQQRSPAAEPAPEKPKTLADFEYDEGKYQSYLFTQAEQRAIAAAERKLKEQAQQETIQRRRQTFQQRESEFAKNTPDYYDVTRDPSLTFLDGHILDAIIDSDEGPALALYLSKNPDMGYKLLDLSPVSAIRELGRIEARLVAEREKAKAEVVTKAPPPAPKIEATDPKVEKDPKDMTDKEFKKWREKQIAQRGR